jgi:hypothetical protein
MLNARRLEAAQAPTIGRASVAGLKPCIGRSWKLSGRKVQLMISSIFSVKSLWAACLLLVGITFLAYLPNADADQDHKGHNRDHVKRSYASRGHGGDDKGNEFTGQSAAWIFGAANLPVALSLLLKGALAFAPVSPKTNERFRRFNQLQKKHLMRFHYWLNPLAAIVALVHFTFSTCRSSSLPEWGLAGAACLVLLGMAMKFKVSPKNMRKAAYRIHTSPVPLGLVLVILLIGHGIVD